MMMLSIGIAPDKDGNVIWLLVTRSQVFV